MSDHWKVIIKSRYLDDAISEEKVESYVPKLITQDEYNEIIGT